MVIINNREDNVDTSKGAINTTVALVSRRFSQRLLNRSRKDVENNKNEGVKSDTNKNSYNRKRNKVTNSLVFNEQEFRNIFKIKNLLRTANISKLQSNEVNVDKNMSGLDESGALIRKLQRVARNMNKIDFAEGYPPSGYNPFLVCRDLSNGQEAIPIPVFSHADDSPPITDISFTYITSMQVAKNVKVPSSSDYGCQCKGYCRTAKACCTQLNNKLPYSSRPKCKRLIEARDIVFECGPRCGCRPDRCSNRVSQKGLQYQLEVYRTPMKGWGVRTKNSIPFGAFVCELVGILKKSEDLDDASHNDYIIDIDCWEALKEMGGKKKRMPNEPLPEKIFLETTKNEQEFCIDCSSFGNVARFINHSCEPNLFVQCVLNSHYGLKQARIVLFAGRFIPHNQELTYDYGYQLDSVVDANGKLKKSPCYCGEATCRKRLY